MVPSRSRLAAVWMAVAAAFAALLFAAQGTKSGLDDPDPSRQRSGFLDAGSLPQPAPQLTAALPRGGRRAVVFFVGHEQVGGLCDVLSAGDLAARADLVVVVAGARRCAGATVVRDPSGGLARRYGLRRPRSDGPRVGYAIVDRQGNIRYRTLDPSVAHELSEVETILRATP